MPTPALGGVLHQVLRNVLMPIAQLRRVAADTRGGDRQMPDHGRHYCALEVRGFRGRRAGWSGGRSIRVSCLAVLPRARARSLISVFG